MTSEERKKWRNLVRDLAAQGMTVTQIEKALFDGYEEPAPSRTWILKNVRDVRGFKMGRAGRPKGTLNRYSNEWRGSTLTESLRKSRQ